MDVWAAGGFIFAQTEHFQFVSIPQRAPDGVLATAVAIHTGDAADRIVTLTNLAITGDVHQAWLSGFGIPTAWAPTAGPTYHESWIPYDSHMLITQRMIGDGIS